MLVREVISGLSSGLSSACGVWGWCCWCSFFSLSAVLLAVGEGGVFFLFRLGDGGLAGVDVWRGRMSAGRSGVGRDRPPSPLGPTRCSCSGAPGRLVRLDGCCTRPGFGRRSLSRSDLRTPRCRRGGLRTLRLFTPARRPRRVRLECSSALRRGVHPVDEGAERLLEVPRALRLVARVLLGSARRAVVLLFDGRLGVHVLLMMTSVRASVKPLGA